jgi:hypothetical protein
VDRGQQRVSDDEGDDVERRLGVRAEHSFEDWAEHRLDEGGDGRLADDGERERGQRDAELRGRKIRVEVVEQAEQAAGAAVARGGQRLDARAAHADEGELGRDEISVDEYDDQNQDQLECRHLKCAARLTAARPAARRGFF